MRSSGALNLSVSDWAPIEATSGVPTATAARAVAANPAESFGGSMSTASKAKRNAAPKTAPTSASHKIAPARRPSVSEAAGRSIRGISAPAASQFSMSPMRVSIA